MPDTIAPDPDANIVYPETRQGKETWVYRASGLGGCQNALIAARMGIEGSRPPAWMQQRFDVGKDLEPIILNKLRERYGFALYGMQETCELDVTETAMVRGHVDALTECKGELTHMMGKKLPKGSKIVDEMRQIAVVDAKAFTPDMVQKWLKGNWEAFPYYAWQQAMYVHTFQFHGVIMAVYDKISGEIVVDYWPSEKIPVSLAKIKLKVVGIERAVAKGPQELFAHPCSPRMFPCPYWQEHPAVEGAPDADGTVTGHDEEVRELAILYSDAQQREKAANADKVAAGEQIAKLFGGVEAKAALPDWTVSTYHFSYSTTDWAAIGEAVGMDADAAKAKFVVSMKSAKLTPKCTAKGK